MATATKPPDITHVEPMNGDVLYEVVNGRAVEKPPTGAFEGEIASLLLGSLVPFVRTHRLGKAVGEVLFRIAPDLQRRPDLAFISDARWPRTRRAPKEAAWDVVPDLAVEVISPTNMADEVIAKVGEYFRAGVRSVWVVYSSQSLVYLYESPESVRILKAGDTLEGGDILPGFRLPLTHLFETEAE